MKKNSEEELLVLFPSSFKDSQTEEGTIHELPDPYSGEARNYWKYGSTFFELNTIHDDDKYSTFCIGNNILSSNKLHASTPVDPLFWLVHFCATTQSNNASTAWQPLEQLLQTVCGTNEYYSLLSDPLLANAEQCQHVLATLQMDDDVYYKFSPDKTLAWLTLKQQNVLAHLGSCRQAREFAVDAECGAFVEGFVLGGGGVENKFNQVTDAEVQSKPTAATATKHHPDDVTASYQMVGNYISSSLREQWTTHLGFEQDRIWGGTSTGSGSAKKHKTATTTAPTTVSPQSAEEWNAAALGLTVEKAAKVEEKPKAVTAGAKRLQKVNKRGMQKMSAFFSSKKKS